MIQAVHSPLQTQFYTHICTGTLKKVEQFIKKHPKLLNEPFEDGSLPLHVAIDLHKKSIARMFIKRNADAILKDSKNLDALDHAYSAGEQKIAEYLLKNITKRTPTIKSRLTLLHQIVLQAAQVIPREALELYAPFTVEFAIRKHSLEIFVILFILGKDLNSQASDGNSLLWLALSENQLEIAHLLLIAGLNPNEQDANNKSLLHIACQKGDMHAVYLLLAYGAKLSEPIVKTIEETAKSHDPLHVTASDRVYFISTIAYWLSRGAISIYPSTPYLQSLPSAIQLFGATWVLYQQLAPKTGLFAKAIAAITLTGLELLPATNIAMQAWKTTSIALSAFFAIQSAWQYSHHRPAKALQKGTIHAVNTLQSLYSLQSTIATEYASSQELQALLKCNNITTDNLAAYESMPLEMRMQEIIQNTNTAGCPPLIELAFPNWNCDTFKKLYREEAFKHHPDKNKDGSSTAQIVLNTAKSLWSNRC